MRGEGGRTHPLRGSALSLPPGTQAPRTNTQPFKLSRQVLPPRSLLGLRLQARQHSEQQTGPKS